MDILVVAAYFLTLLAGSLITLGVLGLHRR